MKREKLFRISRLLYSRDYLILHDNINLRRNRKVFMAQKNAFLARVQKFSFWRNGVGSCVYWCFMYFNVKTKFNGWKSSINPTMLNVSDPLYLHKMFYLEMFLNALNTRFREVEFVLINYSHYRNFAFLTFGYYIYNTQKCTKTAF